MKGDLVSEALGSNLGSYGHKVTLLIWASVSLFLKWGGCTWSLNSPLDLNLYNYVFLSLLLSHPPIIWKPILLFLLYYHSSQCMPHCIARFEVFLGPITFPSFSICCQKQALFIQFCLCTFAHTVLPTQNIISLPLFSKAMWIWESMGDLSSSPSCPMNLVVWPWGKCLPSLDIGFFICKMSESN